MAGCDRGPVLSAADEERVNTANNVLVITFSVSGSEREFVKNRILDEKIGQKNVLHVSMLESSHEILTEWYDPHHGYPAHLAVVSAADMTRSAANQSDSDSIIRWPYLVALSDPSNLEGIGNTTTYLLERWVAEEHEIVIDFDGISDLLDYCEQKSLFHFLHVYSHCVEQADATCFYHYEADSREDEDLRVFAELFDTILVIDANDTAKVTSTYPE